MTKGGRRRLSLRSGRGDFEGGWAIRNMLHPLSMARHVGYDGFVVRMGLSLRLDGLCRVIGIGILVHALDSQADPAI